MGFLKFVMKHGIGSPGSICKAMARTYQTIKQCGSSENERDILRQLYLSRVSAASMWGKSAQYGYSTEPSHVEKVLLQNPDLLSLVKHVIVSEHPELLGPDAPVSSWGVLDEVVKEVLDQHAPGWRR
jgi:hypothetical protein